VGRRQTGVLPESLEQPCGVAAGARNRKHRTAERERLAQFDRQRHVASRLGRCDHHGDVGREHALNRALPADRRVDRGVDPLGGERVPRARVDDADELEPGTTTELRTGERRNECFGRVIAVERASEDQPCGLRRGCRPLDASREEGGVEPVLENVESGRQLGVELQQVVAAAVRDSDYS